jgi:polysaccharide pyruvyl transferase WcaK-like protein
MTRLPLSNSRPKILLIGAYGNGNLGDTIQAEYLARKILRQIPHARIDAVSRSNQSPFGGVCAQQPSSLLKNANKLNSYDAIMIGGGGILASRHPPMCDHDWVKKLKVPVGLIAVGVEAGTVDQYKPLLELCSYISVRDQRSLQALTEIGYKGSLLADPVLCSYSEFAPYRKSAKTHSLLDRVYAMLGRTRNPRFKILWIFRKRNAPPGGKFGALTQKIGDQDMAGSFFPNADFDSEIFNLLPKKAVPIRSVKDFHALASRADFLISDRLHACVLAHQMGIACVGLGGGKAVYPKVQELFAMLDSSHAYHNVDDLVDKVSDYRINHPKRSPLLNQRLSDLSDQFDAEFSQALQTLLLAIRTPAI